MSYDSASPGDAAPQLRSLRDVRILLIGDRLVGKTSLIRTLMNDKFVTEVPPRSPDVAVPPEMTLKEVTTYIIDSSFRVQDEAEIASEVGKASVICVVYAADNAQTYERVSSYWLPFIRKHSESQEIPSKTPVILVRNKSDLCEPSEADPNKETDESENALLNECWSVMQEFKEIVTCVDCSAKAVKHIPDVFHYALNSVLFPMSPLYDLDKHELKPKVLVALERVFAICDRDKDGLLDDDEVNGFQTCCFQGSEPLAAEELKNVKELIRVSVEDGLIDDKVTKPGFLFLNQLFIERGKPETTWAVLRHFGYSDDLELKDHYLYPTSLTNSQSDCSMELSEEGIVFLSNLFDTYASTEDTDNGGLSAARLQDVFAIADEYPAMFDLGASKSCSKTRFINGWRLLALMDHRMATELLSLLGFCVPFQQADPISVARAIAVSRRRVIDWETHCTSRKAFLCYVVGSASSRAALFEANNGSPFGVLATGLSARSATARMSACSAVIAGAANASDIRNHSLVVFAELDPDSAAASLGSNECADECDVVVLLYDESDPESFAAAAELRALVISPGPRVLVVGTNADGTTEQSVSADKFCKDNRLDTPMHLAADELDQVVGKAAALSSSPPSLSVYSESSMLVYATAAAALAIVGIVAYRRYAQK